MRKYYLTLIVMAVFAFGFAASDDSSSSSSSYQEQPKEKQKPPFLGTYELKDRAGILYHFILKEDESVEIIVNPDIEYGKHNKFWGKWWDERSVGGEVQIQYGDIEHMPGITFPNGISAGALSNCPQICNGYFYSDWEQLKKRREGWRLPIKKIE